MTVKFLIDKKSLNNTSAIFNGIDISEFASAEFHDIKIDADKQELALTARILFNYEKYTNEFALPFTNILDSLTSGHDIKDENYTAVYIFYDDKNFQAWKLPLSLFNDIKTYFALDDFSDKRLLQTHKRLWLHISLYNADGELEHHSLPVWLPVTNILFFSMKNSSPFELTVSDPVLLTDCLICAPFLGVIDSGGTSYQYIFHDKNDPLEQRFILHNIPGEILAKIKRLDAKITLEK